MARDSTWKGRIIISPSRLGKNRRHSAASSFLVLLALSLWNSCPAEAFVGLTATPTLHARRSVGESGPSWRRSGGRRPAARAPAATAAAAAEEASPGAGEEGNRRKKRKRKDERVRVTTASEMKMLLSAEERGMKLFDLDVRGESQEMLEAREDEHPVVEALRKRLKAGTKPGSHGDGLKVSVFDVSFPVRTATCRVERKERYAPPPGQSQPRFRAVHMTSKLCLLLPSGAHPEVGYSKSK